MNNSYVLEEQIATLLGYADTRDIYDDLQFRADIIERMIQENILEYHEVNSTIDAFQRDGVEGLPFHATRPDSVPPARRSILRVRSLRVFPSVRSSALIAVPMVSRFRGFDRDGVRLSRFLSAVFGSRFACWGVNFSTSRMG